MDTQESEEPEQELRERITEREDKRRPLEPFTVNLGGHPLALGGEYEIANERLKTLAADRSQLEQQLELEAFYTLGTPLSAFAQVQLKQDRALLGGAEPSADSYASRGEMWLYTERIGGSHFNFDIGRLDYEDERRWWWDVELDSLRLAYETGSFELALALGRELAPERSDRDKVEPEQERVRRLIGEVSWDYRKDHVVQLFLLRQQDRSRTESAGQQVRADREDDSDARLTWMGARLMGVFKLPANTLTGYWLDSARVRGDERVIEYGPSATPGISEAAGVTGQGVEGWALDAGVSVVLPLVREPRLFAGYACGSGDAAPDDGRDRSFRQTGLQANEAGFGGVERFEAYGMALDPELSNLRVTTIGGGVALFKSSSLDLVYHGYRLAEPADSLRNSRLEPELTGASLDLGHGVDAMLALEEWERFELALAVSGFRAGRAFGAGRGRWDHAGLLALRYAF